MVWLEQINGRAFSARDGQYGVFATSHAGTSEADHTLPCIMPAASPLLNQFPSAVSDTECPYRYPPHISHPDLPAHTLPPTTSSSSSSSSPSTSAGVKLPADYDPFKFLSAMTEQCLTGNFPAHEHAQQPPPSCTSAASVSHFLFNAPVSQMYHPSPGLTSSSSSSSHLTSASPHQFYASSSAYYPYGEAGRGQRGEDNSSAARPEVDSYHHHHHHHQLLQQQPQQRMTSPCDAAEGEGDGRGVEEAPATKKNFFCFTEELMDTAEDSDSLVSWTRQHPEHWSHTEVLDWLFYVAQERGLDMQELRGEAFQSLTGRQLSRMTREDFSRLEPKHGAFLYHMFKTLLCGVTFSKPTTELPEQGEMTAQPQSCVELSPYSAVSCDSPRDSPAPPTYHTFPTPPKPCADFTPASEMYWKQERTEWKAEQPTESQQSAVLDIDSYDFDLGDPPHLAQQRGEPCGPEYELFTASYPSSNPIRTSCFFPPYPYPPPLPRRRPGRPRVKSLPEDDDRVKDKKAKNQHLWEFIYETLLNPLYNPQYLRWENQREGVFRFVRSEAVAQLWGSRKNNENMTYEKLSRAMRHYYKRGILERVEGRRLVYKFSRKAMDRVRDKRHNSV
ncbi:uncharacterized protein LOC143286931 isoform X2 [Babylonia areolata]|uniref:uncharacterized protein LOC143286931 isoform X2 n=1 Tax=Babylonia areolata TaxID=304850 RepID=UPI003FCF40E1